MDKDELEMVEIEMNLDNSTEIEIKKAENLLKRFAPKSDNIPEIYDHLEKVLSSKFEQKVKTAVCRKRNRTILYTGEKKFPDYELIINGFLENPSIIQKLSEKHGDPFNFKCLYDKTTNKFEVEVSWISTCNKKKRCPPSCNLL